MDDKIAGEFIEDDLYMERAVGTHIFICYLFILNLYPTFFLSLLFYSTQSNVFGSYLSFFIFLSLYPVLFASLLCSLSFIYIFLIFSTLLFSHFSIFDLLLNFVSLPLYSVYLFYNYPLFYSFILPYFLTFN